MMDTFDLSSISENDQIAAEMVRRRGDRKVLLGHG